MQCTKVKADGIRCEAHAQRGRSFCFQHDPARADDIREAHKRSGDTNRRHRKEEPLPDFSDLGLPETLEEVAEWQARVSEALVRGELDPRRAHELGYNLRALKETLEATKSLAKATKLMEEIERLRAGGNGVRT